MDKSGEGGGGDSRDGGPSSSTSSSGPPIGCGSAGTSGSSPTTTTAVAVSPMTLNVTTTTGGSFSVVVDGENSVENLKKIISKKLKVSKDRICLLHRERELHDGSLRDNGLMDGSKLILTPNVETGLLAQRAENTVMQALESLNDNQVNDFLSGKSPLNLSVRLGDHMMLIQLQLSTLNPTSGSSGSRSKAHKGSRTLTAGASTSSGSSVAGSSAVATGSSRRTSGIPIGFRRVTGESRSLVERVGESQTLTRQDIENIHSIVKNLAESDNPTVASVASGTPVEQSPIRSLSNLVSSSINNNPDVVTCTDPISANLTSCLCKRLDNNDNNSCESNCASSRVVPEPVPSTSSAPASPPQQQLHRTAQNPIARHKTKVQTLRKHISFDSSTVARTEPETVQPVPSPSFSAPNSPQHLQQPGPSRIVDPNSVENPALAEASRNLTQTLRKLSKRVFTSTSKVTESTSQASPAQEATSRNSGAVNSGAVIESMKHHGKGIYSGTFSGTLNPALQDKFGRPKRDISTIIHILNDLLSAAPQCARSGTKIYFEPSTSGSGSSTVAPQGAATAGSSTSSAATFTTPVAAPSPRLVSRCMPTPIQTKKFPGNPGTITSNAAAAATCHRVTAAAAASTAPSSSATAVKIQCKCGHPLLTPTGPATQCQRCAAELENSKTKSKLDSLRLIMQQKKERREARKQRTAPYTVPPAAVAIPPTLPAASRQQPSTPPTPAPPIPSGSAAAAAIVGESQPSSTNTSSSSSSNPAAGSATTTATATAAATTTTAAAATAETAATQSHQLVEEVDTVA